MKQHALLHVVVLIVVCGVVPSNVSAKEILPADNGGTIQVPFEVKGVFPNLTVMAKGVGSDSEAGIGALIPWGDKLWAIG